MLPFFHQEIEYLTMEEGATVHGLDGLLPYFERWMETWETFRSGPTEFLADGDYVVNGAAMRARGRGSGGEVEMEYWQVWLFRDGKVARWEEYLDRQEALEAAGLSE